jgi:hypothetical protein
MPSSSQLAAALAEVDAGLDQSLERLFELIRIQLGFHRARNMPTSAAESRRMDRAMNSPASASTPRPAPRPATRSSSATARTTPGPHVLFYAHYDVQPVDPLGALAHADPFDPHPRPPARRPQDHHRPRRLRRQGPDCSPSSRPAAPGRPPPAALPLRISMLLRRRGGSRLARTSLGPFLRRQCRRPPRRRGILVCDTDMWDRQTPAITTMLARPRRRRGRESRPPTSDLHSGMFGSAARNAVQTQVLAPDHRQPPRAPTAAVALPGFYDGVAETLPPPTRHEWERASASTKPKNSSAISASPAPPANRAVPSSNMVWARPTCRGAMA